MKLVEVWFETSMLVCARTRRQTLVALTAVLLKKHSHGMRLLRSEKRIVRGVSQVVARGILLASVINSERARAELTYLPYQKGSHGITSNYLVRKVIMLVAYGHLNRASHVPQSFCEVLFFNMR